MLNLKWHTTPPAERIPHALLRLTPDGDIAPGRYLAINRVWERWDGDQHITCWPYAWADLAERKCTLSMRIKHWLILRQPASAYQIAAGIGSNRNTVKTILNRHADLFRPVTEKGGKNKLWEMVQTA